MMSKSRLEKLELLKGKKNKGITLVTDSKEFFDAFGKKIDEFKKVLDAGVEVDAYELIEELKEFSSFTDTVSELCKSINNIDLPDININVPDTIKLDGLDQYSKEFKNTAEQLQAIAKIQLPDIDVKVESINQQNAEKITKQIDNLKQHNADLQKVYQNNLVKVLENFDKLIQAVKANTVPFGQGVGDYLPVRRVRSIGNKLVFDDDSHEGRGGGGGGFPPAALFNGESVKVVNPDGTGIDNTSIIYDNFTPVTPKFKVITVSSIGDNEVIAAVSGKVIRVLSYLFVSAGSVSVQWKSGSTDISGVMPYIASTGVSAGYNPKGHFETGVNEALVIELSHNVAVGGHLTYVEVD